VRACRDNRAFLQRAVRHLARAGIRQFLDIGTGLPTMGAVHETAPGARVAYVDYDRTVVNHARALLATTPDVIAAEGDLRRPQAITADEAIRAHLNFSQPVAVLLVAVLHFITDAGQPHSIVRHLMDAVAPGSCLVVSHVTADHVSEQAAATGRGVYDGASAPVIPRTLAEVTGFFDGLKLAEPGVTAASDWHPGIAPAPPRAGGHPATYVYAGVATKDLPQAPAWPGHGASDGEAP
jgi:S-adenosyl methyltransferase